MTSWQKNNETSKQHDERSRAWNREYELLKNGRTERQDPQDKVYKKCTEAKSYGETTGWQNPYSE